MYVFCPSVVAIPDAEPETVVMTLAVALTDDVPGIVPDALLLDDDNEPLTDAVPAADPDELPDAARE